MKLSKANLKHPFRGVLIYLPLTLPQNFYKRGKREKESNLTGRINK